MAGLTGINVTKIRFSVYIISGILSALAGLVLASKLQNGQATSGLGYELNAIAAVAMGGTSMSGGRGGIPQTIVGLVVIGIINNALSLLGVSSYWQTVAHICTGTIHFLYTFQMYVALMLYADFV